MKNLYDPFINISFQETAEREESTKDTLFPLVLRDKHNHLSISKSHDFYAILEDHLKIYPIKGDGSVNKVQYLQIGKAFEDILEDPAKEERKETIQEQDTPISWEEVGGQLFSQLRHNASIHVEALSIETVEKIAFGLSLRAWRFEKYRSSHRPFPRLSCTKVVFVTPYAASLTQSYNEKTLPLVSSIHWGRALTNEPANSIYPQTFVDRLKELESLGVILTVLEGESLRGFGGILGVAQGSTHPAKLAVLEWKGGEEGQRPVVLVGKGVTFDTGGISIKPSNGMEDMKMDKTGAVVVSTTIHALAKRNAKVNVVAIMPLVENMPSGTAIRPGDILTSLSGQTIEVLNTDAEGRLILADALWYAGRFNPIALVDVATLTGAISVALGPVYAGIFTEDSALKQALCASGEETGELLWHMPLHHQYDKAINSPIADMKNITSGYGASSSTAANFLKRFVPKAIPWAHLDIAGVYHHKKDTALCPQGGEVFGVRLLTYWIQSQYENRFGERK